jgi:hypothetical protein
MYYSSGNTNFFLSSFFAMKSSLAIGMSLFFILALSGCNNKEEEKLANLASDLLCLAQSGLNDISAGMADPSKMEELQAKGEEIEAKAQQLLKDSGYEDEKQVEEAFKNVEDKDEFKEVVRGKAKEKCTAEDFLVDGFMAEMQVGTES